jgi:hypothetical protein
MGEKTAQALPFCSLNPVANAELFISNVNKRQLRLTA